MEISHVVGVKRLHSDLLLGMEAKTPVLCVGYCKCFQAYWGLSKLKSTTTPKGTYPAPVLFSQPGDALKDILVYHPLLIQLRPQSYLQHSTASPLPTPAS